jgi:hypothetical protein
MKFLLGIGVFAYCLIVGWISQTVFALSPRETVMDWIGIILYTIVWLAVSVWVGNLYYDANKALREKEEDLGDYLDDGRDTELEMAAMKRCYETGKIVTATRHENGEITFQEFERKY